MIAIPPVLSTSPLPAPPSETADRRSPGRRAVLLGASALSVSACTTLSAPPGPPIEAASIDPESTAAGYFTMRDGARLPYRAWLPDGEARAVILALHGMNDSRDAWEIPAPSFQAGGMALYAPDQRGFGAAPGRGLWPGGEALVSDAREMAHLVRARHPGARLVLMGESMGGAVLMRLAVEPGAAEGAQYVLVAPAVWGRARMNIILRSSLWLAVNLVPGMILTGSPIRVTASDNRDALIRLSRDPLTIHSTRVDTLRGLVDTMDAALAAAPLFMAPALFLYGGKDELVPPEATAATWRSLPRVDTPGAAAPGGQNTGQGDGQRLAYYPNAYHLMMRDLDRAVVIGDAIAWIMNPAAPLPSKADVAAASWLAGQA
jgi:alpha-beta hydrolase superfamily lysophospholipase